MTENEVKTKLGQAARKMARRLTNKTLRERMTNYMVINKKGSPMDVMGYLLQSAFGHNWVRDLGKKHAKIHDPVWVLYNVLNIDDGLLASYWHDIALVNDTAHRDYRNEITTLLNEMADYCLCEGMYNPRNYERVELR